MKLCIDDKNGKYDKDDKDHNDVDNDNDDEYYDVNKHLVKLESDKTDQSTEQWTQYKVEIGNCCKGRRWGRRWGRRRNYKKEVNLLPCKFNKFNFQK